MKDRRTILLAVCFALSLALYCALFWFELSGHLLIESLRPLLLLSFHAVPAFCLQALLCRKAEWNWEKFIPLVLLALTALVGAMYLFGIWGSGWDSLGGALLLAWCLAPAAGCCLGWMYAGHSRWVTAAGWVLLLAVYVWFRIATDGLPWDYESTDLAAMAVLAAGLWLLFRGKNKKSDSE